MNNKKEDLNTVIWAIVFIIVNVICNKIQIINNLTVIPKSIIIIVLVQIAYVPINSLYKAKKK